MLNPQKEVYKHLKRYLDWNDLDDGLGKDEYLFVSSIGSFNYNLQHDKSDVDTRLVYVPGLDNISNGRDQKTRQMNVGEAHMTVESIVNFKRLLMKSNPTVLEALYSRNMVLNDKYIEPFYDLIVPHWDEIPYLNPHEFFKAILGAAVSFTKKTSVKSLSHIPRMYSILVKYLEGKPFDEILYLNDDERKMIFDIRKYEEHCDFEEEINLIREKEEEIKKVPFCDFKAYEDVNKFFSEIQILKLEENIESYREEQRDSSRWGHSW